MSEKAECMHCSADLTEFPKGPCPKCGKEGRNYSVICEGGIIIGGKSVITVIKEYYEKNRFYQFVNIILIFISSAIGYFINGSIGLSIGILLSIINYFLSPLAKIKIKQINRYD